MYKVLIFIAYDEGFWIDKEKDFETFEQALIYATKFDLPYEIYKDYYYISAMQLVARSTYQYWSR